MGRSPAGGVAAGDAGADEAGAGEAGVIVATVAAGGDVTAWGGCSAATTAAGGTAMEAAGGNPVGAEVQVKLTKVATSAAPSAP